MGYKTALAEMYGASSVQPKEFKVGINYSKEDCLYCSSPNGLDGTGFSYDEKCICGSTFGTGVNYHLAGHPHRNSLGTCQGFVSIHYNGNVSPESELKPGMVPEHVLDTVPGSKPEDWKNGHTKTSWIHKAVKIPSGSYITEKAIVTNTAIIGVMTTIGGSAIIFGTVGDGSCISGDCIVEEGVVIPKHSSLIKTPIIPKTQKAKGIAALKQHKMDVPEFDIYVAEKIKTQVQLKKLEGRFVRPCPKNPRHGFVDSRPVATIEEAKALIKETRAADSEAEIVAMPHIKASHSAIWCPGQLTIGPGNDGATAGRDSLLIPILGKPDKGIQWEQLLKDAGITEAPYMELLWTKVPELKFSPKNNAYIPNKAEPPEFNLKYVQLRNGPEVPDSLDFIPFEIKVTKVIEATGDLLAWESKVKDFPKGTVVWHPGGSLASHYAVHCFLNKIPVMTTRKPKLHETLVPTAESPNPNLDKIKRGFMAGLKLRISKPQACYIMFTGCHSTTKWLGRVDTLLGLAMGCTFRLLITASLGEYRYKSGNKFHSKDRDYVYDKVWNKIFQKPQLEEYEAAITSFDKDTNWGQGHGIGGPKWFVLGRYAGLMYNYLVEGNIEKAVEAFNNGTNSVHNNGRFFNKFISVSEMDITSKSPVYAALKVGPILYDSNLLKPNISRFFKDKFKTIDPTLDVEKYLTDRCKKSTGSYSPSAVNTKKLCCDKPKCCGDPECLECHPEVPEVTHSCPVCKDTGWDSTSQCECSNSSIGKNCTCGHDYSHHTSGIHGPCVGGSCDCPKFNLEGNPYE